MVKGIVPRLKTSPTELLLLPLLVPFYILNDAKDIITDMLDNLDKGELIAEIIRNR